SSPSLRALTWIDSAARVMELMPMRMPATIRKEMFKFMGIYLFSGPACGALQMSDQHTLKRTASGAAKREDTFVGQTRELFFVKSISSSTCAKHNPVTVSAQP